MLSLSRFCLAMLLPLGAGLCAAAQDAPELPTPAVPSAPVPAPEAEDPAAALRERLRAAHPWASWEPGAWRRVRVIAEAFGPEGESVGRSVTEQTQRLISCDQAAYEIRTEAITELSGRPTPVPIELKRLWIINDRPVGLGEPQLSAEPASSVSLGGAMTPCQVWRLEQPTAVGPESELLYLADRGLADGGQPTLLRRELTTPSESGGGSLVASVIGVGAPVLHEGTLLDGWRLTTSVTRPGGGRSQTISVHSSAVPGGMHRESQAEYNAEGNLVRWAVTELLAAGRTREEEGGLADQGKEGGEPPAISIEVRPRRFLRLLRQREEAPEQAEPLQ